MIFFNSDFKKFIQLLQKHDVRFLLVGGYAVNLHGYSRSTGDMDILVKRSLENGLKLIESIKEFGYNPEPLLKKDLENELMVFHIGEPPFQIDIMNKILGLEFDDVYERKIFFQIDDLNVPVINLPDLKFTKSIKPRHKDLNDLENLP